MKEITPTNLRCAIGTCPAVYEVDKDNLLVVGKKITSELNEEIRPRVGDDEFAILINREFFRELQAK
jgi:hypothetical protein